MNRICQFLAAWCLSLLLNGCFGGPPVIPLPILVPFDSSKVPEITSVEPKLSGRAYLLMPADEATWIAHTVTDSNSAYLPTEVHVGEITRQVACRVLAACFQDGVSESAEECRECVQVYVKVDHFRMFEIWTDPSVRDSKSLHSSWSWADYVVLKLFVTVRFSSPDGHSCWEKTYESKPRIPHDFGSKTYPLSKYSDVIGDLFHGTLAEVLQQAVIDYRNSKAPLKPVAPASARM